MTNPPLTEAVYYILLSLTEPLHGYGIMQKAEQAGGRDPLRGAEHPAGEGLDRRGAPGGPAEALPTDAPGPGGPAGGAGPAAGAGGERRNAVGRDER